MAYIRKFPEIAKRPKFRGHFGNQQIWGLSDANFEKCSTRKLFVSEKRVQRKWNRDNRSSFEISMTETRNFSRIEHPNWNRVTGFQNRTLSNTTILHIKMFRPIFQLVIHILQPRSVPKSGLRFENFRPEPIRKFGVLHSSPPYIGFVPNPNWLAIRTTEKSYLITKSYVVTDIMLSMSRIA